jgi:hypothetical protein
MKESETQKAIMNYLAWKHIFHYRNNSGALWTQTNTSIGSWQSAVPTLYAWWMGDNQKEFQRQLEAAGGRYILAYAVDDVIYLEDPRLSLLRI